MTAPFDFRWFGTFTGPQYSAGAYNYDSLSLEGSWHTTLPTDLSFKLDDLAAVLFNSPGDYVGFYCNGVSTQLMTLAHSTGQIPTLNIQALTSIFNGDAIVNGSVICNGAISANVSVNLAGVGDVASYMTATRAIATSKKSFDISHPSKEGYRLRYVCLEGPDAEVYTRGKLVDSDIIDLPDYWRDLVDTESIGVTLTPIGHYQELFVEKIEWGSRIKIKNNSANAINCSYVVYGTRKDVSKNISEYKGYSPEDYPGDNSEYVINGGK